MTLPPEITSAHPLRNALILVKLQSAPKRRWEAPSEMSDSAITSRVWKTTSDVAEQEERKKKVQKREKGSTLGMKLSPPQTNRPVKAGDGDVPWTVAAMLQPGLQRADLPFVQGYIVHLQRNWLHRRLLTQDSIGKHSHLLP